MAPQEPIYPYLVIWSYVRTYYVIKVVHACHHMRRFLHRYLVLKINRTQVRRQAPQKILKEEKIRLSLKEGPFLLLMI